MWDIKNSICIPIHLFGQLKYITLEKTLSNLITVLSLQFI
jgi:hypothetical protein